MGQGAAFLALSAITLFGGAVAVGSSSLFRSALGLMLSLTGVAGLFLVQRADFLAVVQVLVYVGGVSVLIVFAIMLTERLAVLSPGRGARRRLAAGAGGVLAAVFAGTTLWSSLPESAPSEVSAGQIGSALLGEFVVPFEAAGLLLLVAMVAAVLVAGEDR
jgi:NADH-quinone oxidoreductase subunit J